MRIFLIIFILIILLILQSSSIVISNYQETTYTKSQINNEIPVLRILMFRGNNFKINSPSELHIKTENKEKIYINSVKIKKIEQKIIINDDEYIAPITITTNSPQLLLAFNKKNYRGNFIIEQDKNQLLLINQINLEEYLYGVIRSEIPSNWPEEAIKAQIIASRTYALFKMKQNDNNKFHLEASTNFQMYDGYGKEAFYTNKLINLTKGIVVTFENQPIDSIYHSSCGGFTEDAEDIWGMNIPYLQGVYTSLCRNSPKFKWEKILTYKQITNILYRELKIFSRIKYIQIGKTTRSRRVITLLCTDEKNIKHEIQMKDFRLWIGNKNFPSNLFTLINQKDEVIFEGRGFGHGVGLCQMCAEVMAEQGKPYEEILQYFYKNIKINKIYTQ